LKTFITRAQAALWFAKNFGQEVKSVAIKEIRTGSKHSAKMASDEHQENTVTILHFPLRTGKGKSRSNVISFRQIL